ncbi:MAG: zinc ribbon domain-containing protein [Candidatus Aminicenantes bacterium]|nr:zinc ribbon domain-containing protein [Candidatus Aminicenantes bacterium]
MPIYEYRCRDCGRKTEVLVRSADHDPELSCRHCRSRNLEKMISSPAAVRMGSSSLQGKTCCGNDERCAMPPCSTGGTCRRD